MDKLQEVSYFASNVYAIQKPEFLESVKEISSKYLNQAKNHRCKNGKGKECDCDDDRMTTMTGNYSNEESIADFAQYVSQTTWNILSSQGYAMEQLVTFFTEMWTQEHNKYSSMETHVHGMGAQISAFYFLDVPKNGCKMILHDPRPGKVIINLPIADNKKICNGSNMVVLSPKPGLMVFTNSWLPHSFTKNLSKESVRFVHMNLSVAINEKQEEKPEPNVEVV